MDNSKHRLPDPWSGSWAEQEACEPDLRPEYFCSVCRDSGVERETEHDGDRVRAVRCDCRAGEALARAERAALAGVCELSTGPVVPVAGTLSPSDAP